MLLITCPVTRTDELVADRRVRPVADPRNRPGVVAVVADCPCGGAHVFLTGRRIEQARARLAAADRARRADVAVPA
ncbi:hypothetical protein SAMN03159343_1793 [Klenkia marina]|uniref:Uncharacterized protein n=1 Tax=Klenkia marina TaxID=1960309 RepID=A0A1G4XZ04_9ACTN|nr:hypothetical protein [Klenkia marina]SCX46386.1 hypothetical protein SAMN03159343_1793 [Klenkia marina]